MSNINPIDPLLKGQDLERELFKRMYQIADDKDLTCVAGAALNILVNCIRQTHKNHVDALRSADQLSAKLKELVDKNYLSNGNRASVFAFDQILEARGPLLNSQKFWKV